MLFLIQVIISTKTQRRQYGGALAYDFRHSNPSSLFQLRSREINMIFLQGASAIALSLDPSLLFHLKFR